MKPKEAPKSEIYFSADVEATGPIPIKYSMLSFGFAAYNEEGELLETFERNLEEMMGSIRDPETSEWWKTQPAAWEECRKNLVDPAEAMKDLDAWVKGLCKKHNASAVFLAYPAGFDFTFIFMYLHWFVGSSVFSFNALDIKSYAMAVLGTSFKGTYKKAFPKRFKSKRRHSHVALDDALGQGELFMAMLKENKKNLDALSKIKEIVIQLPNADQTSAS